MSYRTIVGKCEERLKELPDASVDAIVTDPPYHLTADKKGGTGPASVNLESPYGRARVTTGFMGMTWDDGDIAYNVAMWQECLRVLKPGGYLLSFGGSRTYHRMACAIEDAGFEIRDQIMWIYGSGFPKSHNLKGDWDGWGTALKPAHEPIAVARKPFKGTVAENVLKNGTGALNIAGCRIGTQEMPSNQLAQWSGFGQMKRPEYTQVMNTGRWPANVIHDGSDEVLDAFPSAPGQQGFVGVRQGDRPSVNVYGDYGPRIDTFPRGDSGSAARFFYCAKASKEDRNEGCYALPDKPSGMVSNTSGQHITRRDGGAPGPSKNNHPTVKPVDLMRYLCRLITPPGGTVLDPFMGSGSTGKAALMEGFDFIGIDENPEYVRIAESRMAAISPLFNMREGDSVAV